MSHIRISKEKNYGPLIPPGRAHIIVGLEPLETLRILPEYGNKDAQLIVNARPIYPLNVIAGEVEYPELMKIKSIIESAGAALYWLDATSMAVTLGGAIVLNMIMLGALCMLEDFPLGMDHMKEALATSLLKSKLEANFKALDMGAAHVRRDVQ